jgi:1-aminocyclopropane-1-carboxylate deaminase
MVKLPAPFSDIPRSALLYDRPSDIEYLERISATVNGGAKIWVKRDDCNSGLAFGGNKVRKLEYVVADALASGADTLLTTGGVQSNHMRQTAAAGAKLGLHVALLPMDRATSGKEEYKYAGNVQLSSILGAEIFPVDTSQDEAVKILESRGRKPHFIPGGASTHPFGGLGYARWAFELLEQEQQLGVTFDAVVVTAGSCSTLGGMVAGFKLAQKLGKPGAKKRLLGFSVLNADRDETYNLVLRIAQTAAAKIGLDPEEITKDDFEINHDFLGGKYGNLDDRTAEGVRELARAEGILLDPVYTGKTFTGLLHVARDGGFGGGNVLFCHTGGQSALSAYPQLT